MMTTHHILLALAAIALVGVIAAQDYLYAPLRQESVSAGLTGPYHWWLDASYVVLAAALVGSFHGHGLSGVFATVAAIALILTAVTNTFGTWVDSITNGEHALWHSRFTAIVFVSALALQVSANDSATMWCITAANVAAPAAVYLLSGNSPYTEKVGVLLICVWLTAWAL